MEIDGNKLLLIWRIERRWQYHQVACPVVWDDSQRQKGLTWADANYHLYDSIELNEDDIDYVDDAILKELNEKAKTFGTIKLDVSACEVRWCLLDEEQMSIVMDVPDLN